ncbi:MAG: DUF4097 family beta strand repeat-containing protein [Symbiobacteriaceae bacterium]|nr:DUF4097 family beta strand repeat-containing protein [Symbiobacteriaceae bacterium]
MSEKNEKLLILEMLKEGKISVEEAQRLLEAVSAPSPVRPAAALTPDKDDIDDAEADNDQTLFGDTTFSNEREFKDALRQTAKEASRVAREAARQVRHEMREAEKQLREELREAARSAKVEAREAQQEAREAQREAKREGERLRAEADRLSAKLRAAAAETAEEATREGGYLDGLFSFFERSPGFDIFGSSFRTEMVQEGNFSSEYKVDMPRDTYLPAPRQIRINVHTANGRIIIRGWNEDYFRMTINATVKASSADEAKGKLDNMLICSQSPEMLFVDGRAFVGNHNGISVEIWLPRCYQYEMDLKGSNGRVLLEDLYAQGLEVSTSNGRLELSDIVAKVARLNSSNGSIICDTDIELLAAHSSNGSVRVTTSRQETNSFDITTSNGNISVGVRDCSSLAHDFDLKTSGKIHVDLPGAIGGLKVDKTTRMQSTTNGFEGYGKRVRISARTSNGSIRITETKDE